MGPRNIKIKGQTYIPKYNTEKHIYYDINTQTTGNVKKKKKKLGFLRCICKKKKKKGIFN